jgi:hypothetical protein
MAISMPNPSRKQAKEIIEREREKFTPFFGQPVQLILNDGVVLPAKLEDVAQARLADVVNKPEPRVDPEGKKYTPPIMVLKFAEGEIQCVLEDVDRIVLTLDRIRVIMGEMNVTIRRVN